MWVTVVRDGIRRALAGGADAIADDVLVEILVAQLDGAHGSAVRRTPARYADHGPDEVADA